MNLVLISKLVVLLLLSFTFNFSAFIGVMYSSNVSLKTCLSISFVRIAKKKTFGRWVFSLFCHTEHMFFSFFYSFLFKYFEISWIAFFGDCLISRVFFTWALRLFSYSMNHTVTNYYSSRVKKSAFIYEHKNTKTSKNRFFFLLLCFLFWKLGEKND